MGNVAFKRNKNFTSKLDLNLRKKLVKCYTLGTAFYGFYNLDSPRNGSQISPQFLNCDAGEGWRRSVRKIVQE